MRTIERQHSFKKPLLCTIASLNKPESVLKGGQLLANVSEKEAQWGF